MRRSSLLVLATVALVVGPAWLPATAEGARALSYSTERLDVPAHGFPEFRRIVRATLADPRGWSLGGRFRFREKARRGELTVTLASPAAVQRFPGCSSYYSCRAGNRVLINVERWRRATDTYRGAGRLHAYRQMVINHEVGHALGFGHVDCAAPGAAAVMQQQSKGLGGCRRNPWPLARERAAHGARLGVRAPAPPPSVVVGRRLAHVELDERRPVVRARLGTPVRRRARSGGKRIDSYAVPPITVSYVGGRVSAVTSRSREDIASDRLRAGRRSAATVRRRCAASATAPKRCEVMVGDRAGALTTAIVRDGRVVGLRLAGRATGRAATVSRSAARVGVGARPDHPGATWAALARSAPAATGPFLAPGLAPFAVRRCPGWWQDGPAGAC